MTIFLELHELYTYAHYTIILLIVNICLLLLLENCTFPHITGTFVHNYVLDIFVFLTCLTLLQLTMKLETVVTCNIQSSDK